MCTCIQDGYLLKSHENLHGITYRIKIMLKGIANSKTLDIAIT